MRDGIQVFKLSSNTEGEEVKTDLGKSAKAGQMAVMQSAASRVFTNVYVFVFLLGDEQTDERSPTLIIPPMIMTILEKRGAFGGPRGKLVSSLTSLTLST